MKIGDIEEPECFKNSCKIAQALSKKTNDQNELDEKSSAIKRRLESIEKMFEKGTVEKDGQNLTLKFDDEKKKEILRDNIKLSADIDSKSLQIESVLEMNKDLKTTLIEKDKLLKTKAEEIADITTKYELDDEIITRKEELQKLNETVIKRNLERAKLEKKKTQIHETMLKEATEINQIREDFNDKAKELKVLKMNVGKLRKEALKLNRKIPKKKKVFKIKEKKIGGLFRFRLRKE